MTLKKEIICEHLEELSSSFTDNKYFLLLSLNLHDILDQEYRIDAHLDGLTLDVDLSWELSNEALDGDEPGDLFALTLIAIVSQNKEYLKKVGELAINAPDLAEGFIEAVRWYSFDKVQHLITSLVSSGIPAGIALGVWACAEHEQDPGNVLSELIKSDDVYAKKTAIRCAGVLGRTDCKKSIKECLEHESADIEFWSAWSLALLGERSVVKILLDYLNHPKYGDNALGITARLMSLNNGQMWLNDLSQDSMNFRTVIKGVGILGDPRNVQGIINAMEHEEFARIAGYSFSLMTGADIEELHLTVVNEDDDQPTYSDEEQEPQGKADIFDDDEPNDDETLPLPDPVKVAQWWKAHQQNFQPGQRYLAGLPINDGDLLTVLLEGSQQQRNAAAIEIALRYPTQPLFNTRARVHLQVEKIRQMQAALNQNKSGQAVNGS